MLPIYVRIFGYYCIKTDDKYKTRLQNLLFTARINAYSDKEGNVFVSRRDKAKLLAAAKKERLTLSIGELLGLPRFLILKKHRIGIPLGIFLGALILFLGSNTVWRVEVSGNVEIAEDEIVRDLSALGFGVGSRTRADNYDDIITAYRLEHPEIAWMGIYTQGTTACVRVIENEVQNSTSESKQPSNLVATADAVIVRLDVLHGSSVVKPGSVVKKGDVLAIGVVSGAHSDTVLSAEGKIIGRVTESFSVEVPYLQKEKVEVERKKVGIDLIFFEKTINIFKKTSKTPMGYVIIERKEGFALPNGHVLPWSFGIREMIVYEEREYRLDKADAIFEGTALLESKIRTAVEDGELLSRSVRIEEREDACVLYATVEYTKNIAESLPFTVS